MCESSRDVDLAPSRNSRTTRGSQPTPPPPPGFETDEYFQNDEHDNDVEESSAVFGASHRRRRRQGSSNAYSFPQAVPLYETKSSANHDTFEAVAGSLRNPSGFNCFNDASATEGSSEIDGSFATICSNGLEGVSPIELPDQPFFNSSRRAVRIWS
ncbi:hypothetical protein M407DRAFT_246784 [Tulasnella calospora MUT 4182]|uniref:Uncharacterized protein n=1 Tax=Tulasnella calospora MUT 4182 TaxID=1051891 RepID=A0A0C3PRP1_9AGAM|nr:hypothetical protein M407DRAFT_246832 [Tulasnella calospora MUT 4182]KIO17305.1 hypothetical protein M407DRAFT_246784 [Tulasnella calospora MUT 4182]